ncbi:DNA-binding domain-containing protein [Anabaena cylindrica FACHB-243]|nr:MULTISPECIES: DNA-binding domain-containing protein [Anabaena]MBD2418237.1 DNA-binding domain-containing protein [Anabaena cylindrica FACHB-243]MBY5285218.1 DNA-binding domain-containing protein [Anabaena sp. CCAP 1446/1C]MBY5311219.1 DNA-binding domain-containing protein [Anabaena sp. CCAP 1446/1C]MCM2409306.1 DNA-binding domain-containing protein [Anabaena sp. CCAP 1446/1C]
MSKPQIAIRMPPSLLQKLNNYVELTGTSKTDVVVSAIAQYLGCADNVPLNQRVGEMERRLRELETKLNII